MVTARDHAVRIASTPSISPASGSPCRHKRIHTPQTRLKSPLPADIPNDIAVPNIRPDTLLSMSIPLPDGRGGNPHVLAIQSRVNELVRRYDEAVASERFQMDMDDDDEQVKVPSRWKLGDVLTATHTALTRTGTRMEHAMEGGGEFCEDIEAAEVLGEGEESFTRVVDEVTKRAEHIRSVMSRTMNMVKQMQSSEEMTRSGEVKAAGATASQIRDMKITIEALHKEKSMILGQLQEHLRAQKEMVSAMEDQNQELKKSQIALAMKQDELKGMKEDKVTDIQKISELSQQIVTWRDKYQVSLKSIGEADQKSLDLEKRISSQNEEIIKQEFLLKAKQQEVDKYRERLRVSETHRMKSDAGPSDITTGTVTAKNQSETSEHSPSVKVTNKHDSPGEGGHKLAAKDRLEYDLRIKMLENQLAELQQKLKGATDAKKEFEEDNEELARIVRDLQARIQKNVEEKESSRSNSISVSVDDESIDDNLSTDSDDGSDLNSERDDLDFCDTMTEVVATAFPTRVSLMPESDEVLEANIAMYEDGGMSDSMVYMEATRDSEEQSVVATSHEKSPVATIDMASQVESLKKLYHENIMRMKKQYVSGLVEYKKLVIEQYERRQAEIHQQHRHEIEGLISFVQTRFKQELERRNAKTLETKESLKMLYRAMMGKAQILQSKPSSSVVQPEPLLMKAPLTVVQGQTLQLKGQPVVQGHTLQSKAKSPVMQANLLQSQTQLRVMGGTIQEEDEDNEEGDEATEDGDTTYSKSTPSTNPQPIDTRWNDSSLYDVATLKELLHAAILAMSSSKSRNEKAARAIEIAIANVAKKTIDWHENTPNLKVSLKNPDPSAVANLTAPSSSISIVVEDEITTMLNTRKKKPMVVGKHDPVAISVSHVGCQVEDNDFLIFGLKGLRGNQTTPQNVEGYTVRNEGRGRTPEKIVKPETPAQLIQHDPRVGNAFCLVDGAIIAENIVKELRMMLPFLPPGSYYITPTLRRLIMLQLLRFYSNTEVRQDPAPEQGEDPEDDAEEVMMGSPRDTPFLRRKAIEAGEKRKIQRRRDMIINNENERGGPKMAFHLPPVSPRAMAPPIQAHRRTKSINS